MHFLNIIFCAKLGPICEKYVINYNAIVALLLACLPLIVKISGYPLVASFFVNISLVFNQVFLYHFYVFQSVNNKLVFWPYEYSDLRLYYTYARKLVLQVTYC